MVSKNTKIIILLITILFFTSFVLPEDCPSKPFCDGIENDCVFDSNTNECSCNCCINQGNNCTLVKTKLPAPSPSPL
ncbi:hypothetical protein Glove_319g61 [Diversispora epigaea]|uniref:Uncharacterized protein n=1 Tax=Diversispora epigaea TaxID=1348612 RepID=A0A397HU11_9GLOM|nr:hypothetical protein Glove_319g61 [Diversispora epigaea]